MKKITLKTLNNRQLELKDKLTNLEHNLKEALEVIDSIATEDTESLYDSDTSADLLTSLFINNVCIEVDKFINPEGVEKEGN